MNVSNVSKYITSVFLGAMKYFYFIMTIVILIMLYLNYRIITEGNGDITFGGLGFSSLIFIFILGLTFFKTEFNFLQANNITRRNFFKAALISSAAAAFIMALITSLVNQLFLMSLPGFYFDWVEGIYKTNSMFANLAWSFGLYIMVIVLGWLIAMVYYKLDKTMRIVISFLPVALILLISAADNSSGGAFIDLIGNGFRFLFALDTLNPYLSAINMTALAAMFSGLAYMLIRRLELKS